jgi:hypothetical protein
VFAYVNRQGLRAIGTVEDAAVRSGRGVFTAADGTQLPEEYHLKVNWTATSRPGAISAAEAAGEFGYKLPVRSVFAKLRKGSAALRLEHELLSGTRGG